MGRLASEEEEDVGWSAAAIRDILNNRRRQRRRQTELLLLLLLLPISWWRQTDRAVGRSVRPSVSQSIDRLSCCNKLRGSRGRRKCYLYLVRKTAIIFRQISSDRHTYYNTHWSVCFSMKESWGLLPRSTT